MLLELHYDRRELRTEKVGVTAFGNALTCYSTPVQPASPVLPTHGKGVEQGLLYVGVQVVRSPHLQLVELDMHCRFEIL
jgi:hypothetical protein